MADPFLRKALTLAVDGTDLQEMRKMMEMEIDLEEQPPKAEAQGFRERRRVLSDHRNHRSGAGTDPGDEDIWKTSKKWVTGSRSRLSRRCTA